MIFIGASPRAESVAGGLAGSLAIATAGRTHGGFTRQAAESGHSANDPIADIEVSLSIARMKRERLIWFAVGAALSSIAAVGTAVALRDPPQEDGWYLRVAEQGQSLRDGQSAAQWRGAEIARDCGARSFEIIPGISPDSADATRIPLLKENSPAMNCIAEQAAKAGLWIGLGMEPLNLFE